MTANTTLHLQLPELTPGEKTVPIQTALVRSWLAELPLADQEQSAQQLTAHIAAANRQPHHPTERLRYLETVGETAATLVQALRERVRHHPLPLSIHGEQVAQLIRGLHREQAIGYKRALHDAIGAEPSAPLAQGFLTQALFGAMAYLGELLLDYFQTYQHPEPGIWRDLHQLFRHAERNRLQGAQLTPLHTPYGRESSLQRLYLRLLLLTLASPYRLRQGELDWVNDSLERWVDYCEVRIPPTHESGIGVLVIDLDSDEPADQPPPASDSAARHYRIVMTIDLLPVLRQELTQSQERGGLPMTSVGSTLSADIYRRLTQAWGTSPQRSFSRSERAANLDVTVGFRSLCRRIAAGASAAPHDALERVSDDKPRPLDENIVESHEQDVWSLVYTPYGANPDEDELPPETHRCGTINESAGGFCLVTHRESPLRARVGELVGIRDDAGPGEWEIGVIRWMRDSEKESMEFGVQMIAPFARLIEVNTGDAWQPALVLPEIRAIMQPVSVIVEPFDPPPGSVVTVRAGNREMTLHLERLLESTGSFSHFQCAPSASWSPLFDEIG